MRLFMYNEVTNKNEVQITQSRGEDNENQRSTS
jgi:hypothetical protein